jgi:hypothetical protein
MSDIELIETHDARLAGVQISSEGIVHVQFAHLCVYERLPTRLAYNVTSYSADIVAEGTTSIRLSGVIALDMRVVIVTRDATELDSEELSGMLSAPAPGGLIEVAWGQGQSLQLQCSAMRLLLRECLGILEVWEGAL